MKQAASAVPMAAEIPTRRRRGIAMHPQNTAIAARPTMMPVVLTIDILVVPRASRTAVGPMVGDRLRVAVTAPPVDGEANAAVIAAVAEAFGVRRAAVTIVRGERGRRKTLRIEGATPAALQRLASGR